MLDDVGCLGTESSLYACPHLALGDHKSDAPAVRLRLDRLRATGPALTFLSPVCVLLSVCASCVHSEDVAIDCFAYAGTTVSTGVYLAALAGDSSAVVRFDGDSNYPATDSRGLLYFSDSSQSGTAGVGLEPRQHRPHALSPL